MAHLAIAALVLALAPAAEPEPPRPEPPRGDPDPDAADASPSPTDPGDPASPSPDAAGQDSGVDGSEGDSEGETYGDGDEVAGPASRTVTVDSRTPPRREADRAGSVVERRALEERLPRSAPDALRYEPGVYIQQTAHGQASPFVRGLTGQQTLMMFDGVRLNNSTFRQGPNQYFFTIDSRTVQRLEVIRGSASTRYGSDAMGGVLLADPIEPELGDAGLRRPSFGARGIMRTATADGELGGRAQFDLGWRGKVGFFGGVGYRDVGQLKAGGPIIAPATGEQERSPPGFEEDGKTQRGTGFRELTADSRLVYEHAGRHRFTAGYYDYRQLDSPRTDQCPPAESDGCLVYDEQFRTLVYLGYDLKRGSAAAERVKMRLSYQRQHERRTQDRGPASPTELTGRDDVHTVGLRLRTETQRFDVHDAVALQARYGVDGYLDLLESRAWIGFGTPESTLQRSRGQYVDGSRYLTSGAWAEGELRAWDVLRIRGGGRVALVDAMAPADPDSGTDAVDRTWGAVVGNAGISWQTVPWLKLVLNFDQGFRAPNLDDLTSRQVTGPGFQRENANLDPERSLGLEGGFQIRHPWIELDVYGFQTHIRDLIVRQSFDAVDCPPGDDACGATRTRFQLVNSPDPAIIRGVDGGFKLFLPLDLFLRTTVSYAWGEAGNPEPPPARQPISRIPPVNGTVETGWRSWAHGFYVVGAMRWAGLQDRLSIADQSDARIPAGGTPGYVVFDARAGYRWDPYVLVGLVFENIGDVAYRAHGSAVNGAGRGLLVNLELGF